MTAEPPHRIGTTARRLRRQGDPTLTGPGGAVDDDIFVEWPGSLIERAEGTSRQAASTRSAYFLGARLPYQLHLYIESHLPGLMGSVRPAGGAQERQDIHAESSGGVGPVS